MSDRPGWVPCPTCEGSGELGESPLSRPGERMWTVCPHCSSGWVPSDETVLGRAIILALELGHTFANINPPTPAPNTMRMARDRLIAADRYEREQEQT